MKRIILLLILAVVFSCKDEKKKEVEAVIEEVVEKQYKTVKNFLTEDIATLTKTRVSLTPANEVEYISPVYLLSRITNTESAYLSSGLIPVTYASEYKVSVVVKKASNNNLFGLRLTGTYPDRADAIFDLDKGKVLEYKESQDFEKPLALIEELPNGFYKCTLSAEVAADNIRIIMGATSSKKNVLSWEGKTENKVGIYIVPSSIIIEEAL